MNTSAKPAYAEDRSSALLAIEVAGSPVSYGIFEETVADPSLPDPDEVLRSIAAAGYGAIELGPHEFLGIGPALRNRLESAKLTLAGAYNALHLTDDAEFGRDLTRMRALLQTIAPAKTENTYAILADAGASQRRALGASGHRIGSAEWRRLGRNVDRARALAEELGYPSAFHPHAATHVQDREDIEELLATSSTSLVLDTGHLSICGTDPVAAATAWRERIAYVHLKDVRMNVLRSVVLRGGGMREAWQHGIFCELGQGDLDLASMVMTLTETHYTGWLTVEQDEIFEDARIAFAAIHESQVRNREWVRRIAGV